MTIKVYNQPEFILERTHRKKEDKNIYSDISAVLEVKNGDIAIDTDEKCIMNMIDNVLNILSGERVMRRTWGSNLEYLLFLNDTESLISLLRIEGLQKLHDLDSRIKVEEYKVTPLSEKNAFMIDVGVTIKGLGRLVNNFNRVIKLQ